MEDYLVILTEQVEDAYGTVTSRKALPAKLFTAFDKNHAAFRCGSWLEQQQNAAQEPPSFDKYTPDTDYTSLLAEAFSKSDASDVVTYSVKIIRINTRIHYPTGSPYADPPLLITAELAPSWVAGAHCHGMSVCVRPPVADALQNGLAHTVISLDTVHAIATGEHLIGDSMTTSSRWDVVYGIIWTCKTLAEIVEYVTQLIPAAHVGSDPKKNVYELRLTLAVYLRTSADGRYTALPDDLRLDVFDALRTGAQVEAGAQGNKQT